MLDTICGNRPFHRVLWHYLITGIGNASQRTTHDRECSGSFTLGQYLVLFGIASGAAIRPFPSVAGHPARQGGKGFFVFPGTTEAFLRLFWEL